MPELIDESSHIESTTIGVYRTSATVKGGRRFSFGALVVVGNRSGQVGYGYGKANEVPQAVEKAQKYAKREMHEISRIGTTINHEVQGRFGASLVRLIPASPGTGVVAGGVVRSILEMAGVSDCLTKCYGSTNARNTVKAAFAAIEQLRKPEAVAALRGVELGATAISTRIEKGKAFMAATSTGSGGERKAKGPVNTVGDDRRGGRGGRGGPGGSGGGRRRGPAGGAPDGAAAAPAGEAKA